MLSRKEALILWFEELGKEDILLVGGKPKFRRNAEGWKFGLFLVYVTFYGVLHSYSIRGGL